MTFSCLSCLYPIPTRLANNTYSARLQKIHSKFVRRQLHYLLKSGHIEKFLVPAGQGALIACCKFLKPYTKRKDTAQPGNDPQMAKVSRSKSRKNEHRESVQDIPLVMQVFGFIARHSTAENGVFSSVSRQGANRLLFCWDISGRPIDFQ